MKVIDVLSVLGDNIHVVIIDSVSGEIVSTYDGRNSIDESYNNDTVVRIIPNWRYNILEICI